MVVRHLRTWADLVAAPSSTAPYIGAIADHLGRSSSTVSREIDRNGGRDAYRAVDADAAAYVRARRPKPSKLASDPVLRDWVTAKLVEAWSPQQIAERLRLVHPDEPALSDSNKTIVRHVLGP